MKALYKTILTPITIILFTAVFYGVFWCIGSLLISMNLDFLIVSENYTNTEIAVLGFWHFGCAFVAIFVIYTFYLVVETIID